MVFTVFALPVQDPGQTPLKGFMCFRPRVGLFISGGGSPTLGEHRVPLNPDGTFSKTLEWKDGLEYDVRFDGRKGVWPDFTFRCGTDSGNVADGSSNDIADLTPVSVPSTASAPVYTRGLQGEQGIPGPSAAQAGGFMGPGVQGLYTRVKPGTGVSGITTGMYALAKDPSVSDRVWGVGLDFGHLGFSNSAATAWTPKVDTTALGASGAIHQLLFTGTHLWMVSGSNASQNGKVWRSPLPDASGNGLSFTLMFNLAAPPNGLTSGVNSFFRPQCLAVSGANVYLLEYGTTVTGGPSIYYSADTGMNWSKPKTWANAKHGHAVHVINGGAVVMLGDSGSTDLGLWRATAVNGTGTWNRIGQYGEAAGGNTLYGINFQAVTVSGKAMLAIEYDGALNLGPLLFPDTAGNATIWPLLKTFDLPAAYYGTMRCLTVTSEGNLIWVQTAENGAFGPTDTVWISTAPFTTAVLLDSFTTSSMFLGEPLEDGDYVWFGYYRCHKEKFVGQ